MSITLSAQLREKLGTRSARTLRSEGRLPCNIQGSGLDGVNFHLEERDFLSARRQHEHLFDIEIAGRPEPETALVRELQYDAFGDSIIHVEFRRVIRGQETEAEVELEFIGHPAGGILNHLVTHLTIAAIPTALPDVIEVRVDAMEEGDHLTAGEIAMPEGVRLVTEPDTTVANVVAARIEPEEAPEDEVEVEGGAAPAEGAPPTDDEG